MSMFNEGDIVYFLFNSELKPGKVLSKNKNSRLSLLSYAGKPINIEINTDEVYRDYDSAIAKLNGTGITIDPEIIEIVQYLRYQ